MNALKILRYLLFSVALLPLIYSPSIYFPFITAKTIIFRVLVEASLALYLSIKIKKSCPKLTIAFLIWIFTLIISSALNQNFLYSFFGRIDRNLGIFTLLHLAMYFWLITQVFNRNDFLKLFKISAWTSMLVLLYGLTELDQGRIGSTLGNSAYLAIYSIFNLGFGVLVYLLEKRKLYLILGTINLIPLYLAGVRGAQLGLTGGLIIGLITFYLKPIVKNKKILISVSVFLLLAAYFSYTKVFKSFLNSQTAQTRLIGYNAGIKGFLERPIFGWGHENFNIVFDKHFDSSFYSFSQTETYFDRAHNIFINSLATSGMLGALALALFYVIAVITILRIDHKAIRAVSLGLFTVYMVHLQFVFDDLMSLMLFLAFSAFLINFSQKKQATYQLFFRQSISLVPIVALTGMFIVIFNIFPLKQARMIARANAAQDLLTAFPLYESALSQSKFFGQKEIRVLVADRILTLGPQANLTVEKLRGFIDLTLQKMLENINEFPGDDFLYGKISSLYNFASFANPDRANEYLDMAKKAEESAIGLSPSRIQLYLIAAETLIIAKEYSQALELYDKALSLNGDYLEAQWYAGKGHILAGDAQGGIKLLNEALDRRYKPRNMNSIMVLINEMISRKEYKTLAELYSIALRVDPDFNPGFDIENVSQ